MAGGVAILLATVSARPLPAQQPRAGLAELAARRGSRVELFSSWDRSGGNVDHGAVLEELPDGQRVLARVDGPGRLTRVWSANPSGELRLVVDGETRFAGKFAALFDGSVPPFVAPLARRVAGGAVAHVPIPFRQDCLVTTTAGADLYYQITVEHGAQSETFAVPPGPLLRRDLDGLLAGAVLAPDARTESAAGRLGERQRVANLRGPGEVVELRWSSTAPFEAWRDAWIEIRVDGADRPCLAGPVAAVFGVDYHGEGIETQPIGSLGRARSFRLPMPFARSLRIDLVREPGERAPLPFRVTARWRQADVAQRRVLHGAFHRARTVWGEPFEVVECTGPGHFVGVFLQMSGAPGQRFAFLEGDETITVDGAVALRGTGTEDYFSGAWYFRGGVFGQPFHAVSTHDESRGEVAAARWHVPDPIPFERSLRFSLEHGGANDTPDADYAAMAFWYGDAALGREAAPAQRRAAARPWTKPIPVRLAAAEVWPQRAFAPDGDRGPRRVRLPAGAHALLADAHPGPYLFSAWLDDARVGPPLLARDTGGAWLLRPTRDLEFDRFELEPYLPAIRAWRVVGPFPAHERRGVDQHLRPDHDPDRSATYRRQDGTELRWKVLPKPGSATGYVDFKALFPPGDAAVAYAATTVNASEQRQAVLILGSDDAVKVFWNGAPVFTNRVHRGATRDQDRVEVTLQPGANRLVLKVENYVGGWGFFARFADPSDLRFDATL